MLYTLLFIFAVKDAGAEGRRWQVVQWSKVLVQTHLCQELLSPDMPIVWKGACKIWTQTPRGEPRCETVERELGEVWALSRQSNVQVKLTFSKDH
eukprot:6656636-Pyramimonas_sp.AAC.1